VASIKEIDWLILGGGGQLGRAMVSRLSERGIPFSAPAREELDITDEISISSYFKKSAPQVVVNAAAWTNVDLAEEMRDEVRKVNAIAPKLLAEKCAESGSKFLHVSTDYVFAGDRSSPWDEDSYKKPASYYGKTKSEGEDLALKAYPENTFIIRTSWLYSPWRKNFVKTILRKALDGSSIVEVVVDQIGQPTSALELSNQIVKTAEKNISPGVYHATNSGETSWFGLAKEIFEIAGESSERVKAIESKHYKSKVARPEYSVLGHTSWIREGISPMSNWKDALRYSFPKIVEQIQREEN
jgi:dTDP-4-dehydrorhamnose reductase